MSTSLNYQTISVQNYLDSSVQYWKSGLRSIDSSLNRIETGGMQSKSPVIGGIKELYAEYYNISKKACTFMMNDWNLLRVCLRDMEAFDFYMKSVIEKQYKKEYRDNCQSIWDNDDLTKSSSDLSADMMSVDSSSTCKNSDNCIVYSSDIEMLNGYLTAFDTLIASAIPEYRDNIMEFKSFYNFKGRLADASRSYIYEVHSSILNALQGVAETFYNLIKSYQDDYSSSKLGSGFKLDIDDLKSMKSRLMVLSTVSEKQITEYNYLIKLSRGTDGLNEIPTDGDSALVTAALDVDRIIRTVKTIEDDNSAVVEHLRTCVTHLDRVIENLNRQSGFRILSYNVNDNKKLFTINNRNPLLELDTGSPEYILSKMLSSRGHLTMSIDETTDFLKKYGIEVDTDKYPFAYYGLAKFYRDYTSKGGSGIFAAERVLDVLKVDPNLLSLYGYYFDYSKHVNESEAKYIESLRKSGFKFPEFHGREKDLLFDIECHPMVVIPKAILRAEQLAWDDRHGYIAFDPLRRFGPEDYDCISVVVQVYLEQGLPLRATEYQSNDGTTVFSTGLVDQGGCNLACNELPKVLTANGFVQPENLPESPTELHPGAVLHNDGHGEIYIGHEQTVSASKVGEEGEPGAWYNSSAGDQRRLYNSDEGKPMTRDALFNGEISRDSLVGNYHNHLKDWQGEDYYEDSHDEFSVWTGVYDYVGKSGVARIDYNEIQAQLDQQIDYRDDYINEFREHHPAEYEG